MRRASAVACLQLFAATAAVQVIAVGHAGASPPPVPPEMLAWAPGLAAAEGAARERKAPLVVILNMDGERGNEAMLTEVYADPKVREAAAKCVVTIASLGRHAPVDDPKAGRQVCSKFGVVTCDEHRATEEIVRKEWLKRGPKDDVESPRHIFRAPDGRLLFERVWTLDAAELVALLHRAVAACTPESLAAWDTVEARCHRAFEPLECVRRGALSALLAMHDPSVDAKLFELTRKSGSDDAAGDLVRAMSADLTPSRAEGIRKLLSAPEAPVRKQAAAAVARMKEKDAFDVLTAAFAKEKAADVKCVLLRAAAVSGGAPEKTREFLLKHAKSGEDQLRTHAIVALAPWAKEDAVVAAVRKLPKDDKLPENLRAAAVWTLGLCERKELADEFRPLTAESKLLRILPRVAQAAMRRLDAGPQGGDYVSLRGWIAWIDVQLPGDGVK